MLDSGNEAVVTHAEQRRLVSGRERRFADDVSPAAFCRRPRFRVGGVQFAATTLQESVAEFVSAAAAHDHQGFAVRLGNAYSVALSRSDPVYRALLNGPGVTLPDGAPIARIVHRKARAGLINAGRVRGPSFFVEVLDQGRAAGLRHFVLGASPTTLDTLAAEIGRRFPGAVVAGTWSPPYAPLDEAFYTEAVRRVQAAAPDVLWLGLGTPKQDFAAGVLADRLGIPTVGVGAAFDFFAGNVPEAPPLLRDHGLEWAYRLLVEPRRLWRRYLFGNALFLIAAITDEWAVRRERSAAGHSVLRRQDTDALESET